MEHVIEVSSLVVDYQKKRAVDNLTFRVARGHIFGFLGPNGAGKSTTIKSLLGLTQIKSGDARLHGLPASDVKAREKVGYLPEEATYYRFLSPWETMRFYGEVFRVPGRILKERIEVLLSLVGLYTVRHNPIRTFSKGMTQKLSLAQALINDPETLILDEPTSGLDPLARLALRDILTELKRKGKTIFFSSHELSEVELLCDSIAIIKSGALVTSGTLGEVLDKYKKGKNQNLERFFLEAIKGDRL